MKINNSNSFLPNKLSQRDKINLIEKLEFFYDSELSILKEYNFYYNENTKKIHISKINLSELEITRFSGVGIYFGVFHDSNRFRLSLEGSKFIKPKRNFIKINQESLNSYLAAENLFKDEVKEISWEDKCPFLIVIYENENLGSISVKDDYLLNYLPKSRKLDFNKLF